MSEETTRITLDCTGPVLMTSVAGIVCAYVGNNHVQPADLPALIASVYATLSSLDKDATAPVIVESKTPAEVRKSITPEALISFEDGRPYKTLRRHLTCLGLTPEAYRRKWGLPADYPMTSADYSAQRSALAKSLGLGQQRRENVGARQINTAH